MSDDIIYNANGEPIGVRVEIDGGGAAIVDSRGMVVAAIDGNGTHLDPDDLEVVDEDDFDDDLDYSEPDEYEDDPEMNINPEIAARLDSELNKLEKQLGRKVTNDELHVVGPRLRDQMERFGYVDMMEAVQTAEQEGDKLLDVDSPAGRAEYINRRLSEKNAESQPEHQPRHYDLDDSTERHAFIQARSSGQFDPDAGDSTSDTPENY